MLPLTALTWAVNRLTFAQRGRGTGLATGMLFIGHSISTLLIAALASGSGGLQPARHRRGTDHPRGAARQQRAAHGHPRLTAVSGRS
jgi:hypothetical protein